MTKVLITGGLGFIGSHTTIELLQNGFDVVVVDNLINSKIEVLKRIELISGKTPRFYKVDLCDKEASEKVFKENTFDAVIHFAGLKSVGESVQKPLRYYENNITSTLNLIDFCLKYDVEHLVFSSSATVYGVPEELPLFETSRVGIGLTNPYGWTKFMIEQMLQDVAKVNPQLSVTLLRYFNPIGAHESGLIGEEPAGIPNNLLPYVSQVAIGKLKQVSVFGNDYDTPDGTGVRDYIHVMDLAKGHIAALNHEHKGVEIYNLGTGRGVSVLELIRTFSEAVGKEIPYKIMPRRAGDVASCYSNADKAKEELGWTAGKTLLEACCDAWRWQSKNQNGFE
ncbi:UDP-glucose 4-epimerase GalE [Lactovum odontotermitis]